MNYWEINGMTFEAVRLPTALHKYGQWYERTFGKPPTGTTGMITWKKLRRPKK